MAMVPISANINEESNLDSIDFNNMKPSKKYRGNKQGTLSFTVVSPEHINDKRTSTATKLGMILHQKRKADQLKVVTEKKAKRDAFYAALAVKLTIPTREIYARNADRP